jgi:hypothetical protein
MRSLAVADVAALGTITLQVEIRLHLPFHHHFLDRLQQRFAFVQRETKGRWREVMTLHTSHFAHGFLAFIGDRDDLDVDLHPPPPVCHTWVRSWALMAWRSMCSG